MDDETIVKPLLTRTMQGNEDRRIPTGDQQRCNNPRSRESHLALPLEIDTPTDERSGYSDLTHPHRPSCRNYLAFLSFYFFF
jgi:hypothetical protein